MAVRQEVFFLAARTGRRFGIASVPDGVPRGALLYLAPFAEEMNKSRRMAALGARAFAEHGWLVLQLDAYGCGDSSGDFGDAHWDDWLDDVTLGWDWLGQRAAGVARGVWCLRAGSLLAADWLKRTALSAPLLLWQPVGNGKQHLTQFLRLKAANGMLAEQESKQAMAALRDALQRGDGVEVAGYRVSAALAAGLETARLELPAGFAAPVVALEVSGTASVPASPAQPSPAFAALCERWRQAGIGVHADVVAGPPFWQAQEIETVPALIDASLQGLAEWAR